MNYYTVPIIGTGTSEDPFRPDIPEGTPFVGNTGPDGEFLIATPSELADKPKRQKQLPWQAVENACNAKGLRLADVQKWRV